MVGFIIGFIIGGTFGVFISALCVAAGYEDESTIEEVKND